MTRTSRGRPQILGIVNITEDSFSDGGRYLDPDKAIAHARALVAGGADIVDLGPASSHPDARPVSGREEIRRLEPVIAALRGDGIPVSVDSFLAETQRYAIAEGVAFLNDIQGFPDEALYDELAAASCRLIVMHSVQGRGRATRTAAPEGDIVAHASRFFDDRIAALEGAGVAPERLILDPGMGFFLGNTPPPSVAMLQRLPELKRRFGLPVLVSVSRKSFLQALTGRTAAGAGAPTLAAELYAAAQGADFLRTHDAAALADGLAVRAALTQGCA